MRYTEEQDEHFSLLIIQQLLIYFLLSYWQKA